MIPNFKWLHNWLTPSRQSRSRPWADDRKLPLQRPNLAYLARGWFYTIRDMLP